MMEVPSDKKIFSPVDDGQIYYPPGWAVSRYLNNEKFRCQIDNLFDSLTTSSGENSVFTSSAVKQSKTDLMLITVAPAPELNEFSLLKEFTESIATSNRVQKYAYVYELQENGNPHSHILIKSESLKQLVADLRKKRKATKWQMLQRTEKSIDFRYFKKTDWDKGIRYLTGLKKGTEKPMYKEDILFRTKYNLQSIYQYDNGRLQTDSRLDLSHGEGTETPQGQIITKTETKAGSSGNCEECLKD